MPSSIRKAIETTTKVAIIIMATKSWMMQRAEDGAANNRVRVNHKPIITAAKTNRRSEHNSAE